MAPIKRKKESEVKSARPEKKQKPSTEPHISVLKAEEPSFPRGGASVLTPLEHKQIQIQAKQDVLFEHRTGKKATNDEFEDHENEENLLEEATVRSTKTKRKSRSKGERSDSHAGVVEHGLRIEGLSYRRLTSSSLVLGQVSQINRHDLALSLPNNLTGYVPLTSISDKFNNQLESLAAEEDDVEDDTVQKRTDVKTLVFIGQYLRAFVTSTEKDDSSGGKGKRHIELSIRPQDANAGLSRNDLVANSMIQASVISVEDHGLVMDLGLGQGIRGFMSSKETGFDGDIASTVEGSVCLCLITGKNSDGSIIKLSADPARIGAIKKGSYVTDAPTVDPFLPGTAVDFLVSEVTQSGIAGKVMGSLNVTADFIHSGAASSGKDLEKKYITGSNVKGRIICTFPTAEVKKLGVSLQDHILYWKSKSATSTNLIEHTLPADQLPISSVVDQATVVKVEHGLGLLLDMGVKGVRGFVHISQISDAKIETLSETTGPYKIGSQHKARITGYNSMDGLFIVSMAAKVIDQPFLRLEDVKIGQVVKGTIEKIIVNASGVSGLLVNIAEGITGLVPEVHFADIQLQHPERKFKEGNHVTARVLSTDPEKRQIRLTLKKALVNSDIKPWTSYNELKPNMQAPGTLVNVTSAGAVVQFYGHVRAFLPVAEMSESFIQDPRQHFKKGQVVNIHIVSVDPEDSRMIVSCKDPLVFGTAQEEALRNLKVGESVVGNVIEKTNDEIVVELESSQLKATVSIGHLADGSPQKCQSAAKRIRVGQVLKDLIILNKEETKRLIRLTSKPSLISAAKDGSMVKVFEDVAEDSDVHGFVRNITPTGVFVQFAGDVTALLLKHQLPEEATQLPDFGMQRNQSLTARVLSIDYGQRRFLLTLKPRTSVTKPEIQNEKTANSYDKELSNPVDGVSSNIDDFTVGKLTKARIVSVKETQINVQLADSVQGRIDVSEVFDTWDEINDRKYPLKKFHSKQILSVRILGLHDSRNHRFLPITHRGKAPVFELTAKPSNQVPTDLDILSIDKVQVGSTWLTFVNNVADNCLLVNLSPNVRGRVRAMDISDNVSQLNDLAKNFPVGSVLRAKVLKVDLENNRLDLSSRFSNSAEPVTINDLSVGSILPGRVTKVTERQVMVQLSESLSAPVHLVDMADDYSKADPSVYQKNQIIRVCVKSLDVPNKKITLSLRPSKILSSSLPVRDPDLTSTSQLKVNDIVRGFVKNIADNGVFVSIASNMTAFIRISDLSDEYLKDWKSDYEIDQRVEGKIIAVNPELNHIQMSLKRSHLDNDYKPPLTFSDMKKGQIVTGKVRKIEDFGVFIVVDNSANVSGLCHRTKMSDQTGANPKKLYEEGDLVKGKVLSISTEKKRISFGLKASYFNVKDSSQADGEKDSEDNEEEGLSDDAMLVDGPSGVDLDQGTDESGDEDARSDLIPEDIPGIDSGVPGDDLEDGGVEISNPKEPTLSSINHFEGLSAGGFDVTGGLSTFDEPNPQSETDTESVPSKKKKKRRKPEIHIDRTGDLDAHGPQSESDFQRLLFARPHSSVLWLQFMAFYLNTGDVTMARHTAERAIKTINDEDERLNVWIAKLNLENTYGDDASLDETFKKACQHNDPLEISLRLASIHIQSHNYPAADALFQTTLRKHTQSPSLYTNYATFLFTQLAAPERARALLPRALQALPTHTHLTLTSKFAQLEFTTEYGETERGRTVFETLLAKWPRRLDLWNVLLDLEMKGGDKGVVRGLFGRVTGKGMGLKPRKAKFFFKKWLDWEMKAGGSEKEVERVKALAAEYVRGRGKEVDVL